MDQFVQVPCHTQGCYFVDFSESEGKLLVYLMESPSLNKKTNLWLNNVELRDNGVISIGTIMRIISPLPVSSYLRGDIPLIQTQYPAIVLKKPRTYLEVLPLENLQGESSRSFCIEWCNPFLFCLFM